jgi:hypothetical protein
MHAQIPFFPESTNTQPMTIQYSEMEKGGRKSASLGLVTPEALQDFNTYAYGMQTGIVLQSNLSMACVRVLFSC